MNGRMVRLLRVHLFDKLGCDNEIVKGIYQEGTTDEAVGGAAQ